ncbi:hypothetical protein GCM10027184_52400 [Saccharothrix stipae]
MNQVERWFGLLTDKLIRRGVHTSVTALENDITAWIDTWNDNPRPFTWTKTADEILNSLAKVTDHQKTRKTKALDLRRTTLGHRRLALSWHVEATRCGEGFASSPSRRAVRRSCYSLCGCRRPTPGSRPWLSFPR